MNTTHAQMTPPERRLAPPRLRQILVRTWFALAVAGIAMTVAVPVWFLFSLSFMSDAEAYNEWPLPVFPSLTVRFDVGFEAPESATDATASRGEPALLLRVYNRSTATYVPLSRGRSLETMAAFVRRKTNARLTADRLRREVARLDDPAHGAVPSGTCRFAVSKDLFANYRTFFTVTTDAVPALLRSLWTALATVLISLLIGGSAGYAFARCRFRGKEALRFSVLFVRIFPGVAVAMPMVIILAQMGLYDRPLGLALTYSVGQMALCVWITGSVFMGIPVELEEAAAVFGASRAGAFFRVTLPLALPGLAACALVAFIGSWNETIQAIVLTQARPTFPVVVYEALVGAKGAVHVVTAGGVTMALPALVFTLIVRNYMMSMWGSVKL